jgi:hypothetical protein
MNEVVLANRAADWRRLKMLVLDSVSSPITKRVYNLGLDEFFEWFGREPRPGFTKATVSAWRVALENRADQAQGERMSEKVVWQLLQPYATAAGVPGIAPHDLRRSCAKMCRAAGGELEQIQLLLGHASVQTTERYLGTKQDLVHAPNDGIKLRVVQ